MGSITARVENVGRRVRNVVRPNPPAPAPATPATAPARTIGVVEDFSRYLVKGWVSVPVDAPPTKVSLHIGKVRLSSTYATDHAGMSGAGEDVWHGNIPLEDQALQAAEAAKADAVAPGRSASAVPGPADDRRNSNGQIRTFSFRVRGIWPYVKKRTPISIRIDGSPLPIAGHGMFLNPTRNGAESPKELRRLLGEGYVLTQMGGFQLSKQLDVPWQETVMGVYQRVRKVLQDYAGYDAFLIYGTLLGAVREGGYIGHDADFDSAFVSKQRTGEAAVAELREIALLLLHEGFAVEAMRACLHIHDRENPEHRIDLFHVYFDDEAVMRFPFGVAGTSTLLETDWSGTKEVDFPGGKALIPVNGEQVVEHLYGADWRRPKPGFNWNLDRTDWARDALISPAMRTEIYWANFYSGHEYTTGSPFFQFIDERPDTPSTLVDIGCGDGRDACAFGASGRSVLGLDQSAVGIEHAADHAERLGVADRVTFRVCDVSEPADIGGALDEVISAAPGPVLFYLRFFLHAIPAPVQESLMEAISNRARPGDLLAAEFRTDKDQANKKVHTKHYRRYQTAESFRESLSSDYGFGVVHDEERSGLSPYGEEDPILFRVVAVR